MHELILASQSPRRKQILMEAGYQFRTFPVEVSEILDKNLNEFDQISHCARQKAEAALAALKPSNSQNILILAADTLVLFEGEALGKPQNSEQALATLRRLSGQTHRVVTGFAFLQWPNKRLILGHAVSQVEFHGLTEVQIQDYVQSGEPMDKAGSYGIQTVGETWVKKITGEWNNIVGLPLVAIENTMKQQGWVIAKSR